MRAMALLMAFAAVISGCGETEPSPAEEERYLTLSVGATWTFQVTNQNTGAVSEKVTTVEALEDVGGSKSGVMAFRVRTEKDTGHTLSWQEMTATGVLRHREQAFDIIGAMKTEEYYTPHKLRLDEAADRIVPPATWSETYSEIVTDITTSNTATVEKTEGWTVEAVGEVVTVPAGTFTCMRLRRVSAVVGQTDKVYWYARGVGKVKESGGQTEELVSFAP